MGYPAHFVERDCVMELPSRELASSPRSSLSALSTLPRQTGMDTLPQEVELSGISPAIFPALFPAPQSAMAGDVPAKDEIFAVLM